MEDEAGILFGIIKDIDQEILSKEGHLSRGGATDFADYKYRCGVVFALRLVRKSIEERMKKMGH